MMGVRYEWADDRQIIMNVHLEQPWTWSQYNAMMAALLPLLRDLNRPCATVVDCSRLGSLPKDGNPLNILMNVEKSMPGNVFASAIVAAPYGGMMFMNMLMKLRPHAKVLALFTKTTAEAYEKIYARYAELQANPDASPPVSVKG
ncbi:MAG: hypothetical protein ABI700_12730 [Chloroflexota bacterium]